jgi:hypothetical protein
MYQCIFRAEFALSVPPRARGFGGRKGLPVTRCDKQKSQLSNYKLPFLSPVAYHLSPITCPLRFRAQHRC